MELSGENIILTPRERIQAGFTRDTVPLNAARIVAEQLLTECMPDIEYYQKYADGLIKPADIPRAPIEAYQKQRVAQRLLDIADLELGLEE